MKIGIIGAGSIGLLFASYMRSYCPVTLYTRTIEQANAINKNGLILVKGTKNIRLNVNALPFDQWKGKEVLSIIAVKQYQLDPIIAKINELPVIPENLLFLQNGMGHITQIKKIQVKNIFVGSVEHGAYKLNAYSVSHNGVGVTNVSVFSGQPTMLNYLSSSSPLEFPFAIKEDYYTMLRNKLIVNAVINPLTAILQVKNGELISNPFYFHVVGVLYNEISSILKINDPDEIFQLITDICDKTAENRSSMLKDIEAKRKTEVDAILGFLIEEANRQDMKAPQVECLFSLIKGKEFARGILE